MNNLQMGPGTVAPHGASEQAVLRGRRPHWAAFMEPHPIGFIRSGKCSRLRPMNQPLKLGIAGLGTVGTGLLQLLGEHGDRLARNVGRNIEVVGVSARSRSKKRAASLGGAKWFDDPTRLAADPSIDVFVELIGGEDGAAKEGGGGRARSRQARGHRQQGAARQARHRARRLAEKNGVALNFEAAVAGGIPVIKTLREALAGNQVRRVYGILNGTCNYILTQMQEEHRSFADVLGGGAGEGLRRGRSHLRHRRLRHRPQARPADEPGLRHARRARPGARGGHRGDQRRPTSRRPTTSATASSCWAWR